MIYTECLTTVYSVTWSENVKDQTIIWNVKLKKKFLSIHLNKYELFSGFSCIQNDSIPITSNMETFLQDFRLDF